MANASVEKLKALGLRHGEKAVVGLTAAICFAFIAMAIAKPTIEIKPEQLSADASSASSNLSRPQPQADILAKLENEGLIEPKLVKLVDSRLKDSIKPDIYKAKLDWVTPEPGAGLIRDQPELIAPTELAAFPGRGGLAMFKLDENNKRLLDTGADAKKEKGRAKGSKKANPRTEKPEDKKRRESEEEKRKAAFAGKADIEKDKEKAKADGEEAADPASQGPWQEETRGKRWVVITGVIDNEQLKKNYLLALKNPAIAYPNYVAAGVERRQRQSDGSWTAWTSPDQDKNYLVLDNVTELETEYVPATQRIEALVDPIPFLKAGYWSGVHVARLVPRDILEGPKNQPPANNPMGGMMSSEMGSKGGRGGGASSMQGSSPGAMAPGGMAPGGMVSGGMMGAGNSVQSEGGGKGGGMPGAPGMGGGGDADEMNFTKVEEKVVMIRRLDFTVEPDVTYQYRVRIVVANPNRGHTDVNPGVDTDSKNLNGPWSEPTDPVTLPADVAAYAQAPQPTSRRDDIVRFQVIKWDNASGETLVKDDGAGPGELIGDFGPTPVPSSEGKGQSSASIDFNSRAIVLDSYGGAKRLPDIGVDRNQFIIPAMAMIIEPDGSVVIRDQARDRSDEVREDMESNYNQAIADSGKIREKGKGSRMPGRGGSGRSSRGMGRGGSMSGGGGGSSQSMQ